MKTCDGGKEAAAKAAVDFVYNAIILKKASGKNQFVLGVGSGSTVALFMNLLSKRIGEADEQMRIVGIPTSLQAKNLIIDSNGTEEFIFEVGCLDQYIGRIDVLIDGADEIAHDTKQGGNSGIHMIKGQGGAHVLEKIVAVASKYRVYLIDENTKLSERLGQRGYPVPVEIMPSAVGLFLVNFGKAYPTAHAQVRLAKGAGKVGPVITDSGNVIVDVTLPRDLSNIHSFEAFLSGNVGVLGTGLFLNMADEVIVGKEDGVSYYALKK